jgi:hypothetical protein
VWPFVIYVRRRAGRFVAFLAMDQHKAGVGETAVRAVEVFLGHYPGLTDHGDLAVVEAPLETEVRDPVTRLRVPVHAAYWLLFGQAAGTCPDCRGQGWSVLFQLRELCRRCSGTGHVFACGGDVVPGAVPVRPSV